MLQTSKSRRRSTDETKTDPAELLERQSAPKKEKKNKLLLFFHRKKKPKVSAIMFTPNSFTFTFISPRIMSPFIV